MQRNRKAGRRFRFGFVHFFSRALAEAVVTQLNGTKLGGVHISVSVARFPQWSTSKALNQGSASLGLNQMKVPFVSRLGKINGGGFSWRDVVAGKVGVNRKEVLALEDECMFSASWRFNRLSVDALFPEWRFETRLEGGEAQVIKDRLWGETGLCCQVLAHGGPSGNQVNHEVAAPFHVDLLISKRWLAHVHPLVVLLCSDQQRLALVKLLSTGLDRS